MIQEKEKLRKFVDGVRRRTAIKRAIKGSALLFSGFFLFSTLLNIFFAFFPWVFIPLLWDFLLAATIISAAGWIIDSFTFHFRDLHSTAVQLEKNSEIGHSLLSIAFELDKDKLSGPLVDRVYKIASEQIAGFKQGKDMLMRRCAVIFPGSLILWVLTLFIAEPSVPSYWRMPLSFLNKSDANVTPGTLKIRRGARVDLRLNPIHTLFPSCGITITSPDGNIRRNRFLRPDSSGSFCFSIDSVKESFLYRFSYGGRVYGPETVTVIAPPVPYSLQVTLFPPAYTGAKKVSLPQGQGDFTAYSGTKVKLELGVDDLSDAWALIGKDSIRMSVNKSGADGEFTIWKQSEYTFLLKDIYDQFSDTLPSFQIGIIPDEPPVVHFLKPGFNKALSPAMVETLWVEGIDDLGISSMKLSYRKNGEDSTLQWDITSPGRPKVIRKVLVWNLKELSLYPGDTLFYWAVIRDSKPGKVAQTATSDTFWFRIPGFEEIHRKIVEQEKSAEKSIGEVREKQDHLEDMLENLVKSATGQKELSWDQKQILQDVKETIKAQADTLQKAMESLRENIERLKSEGTLGEEITEKMEQIQKSLEELIELFGDSLLAGLQNKQEISWDEMKEAIEQAGKMLPELNERLDNTLQFLELLKRDREMATLALQAEKLAGEQLELERGRDRGNTLEEEKRLLDRIGNFLKELSNPKENPPVNTRSSDMVESMKERMESEISQNQVPSSESMNQMSGSLMSLSQELREMMSSGRMQRMQMERDLLLDMAHDALSLSQWQEMVREQLRRDDERTQIARSQQAISDALEKLFSKTDSLRTIPPTLKQELRENFMNSRGTTREALKALGETSSTVPMKQNQDSFNSLAESLLGAASMMEQQGSGGSCSSGGMLDGLRQLSGRQSAINSATAELLRQMMGMSEGGGQSSGEQGGDAEGARREAEQAQKALAEELKKLAEKYGDESGEQVKKRVEELEKEARRIAAMLEKPKQEVVERQDRFLSRMLQAALSLNRQDEGKEERKSRTSEKVFNENKTVKPGEIIDDPDTFHLIRRKALQGNFPENYRSAVKAYFDSLGVMFLNKAELK